jgi:hypothetical protein
MPDASTICTENADEGDRVIATATRHGAMTLRLDNCGGSGFRLRQNDQQVGYEWPEIC